MPKNKIIAITIVAIVAVASIGAFLLLGESEVEKEIKRGRFTVFGNANNDDRIDNADVELIREIANSGEWDQEKYPYADVNYDGDVNQLDVIAAEKMVNREHDHVYYLNGLFEVKKARYPVKTLIGTGSFILTGFVALGLEKQIYGISDSKSNFDNVFWGDIKDLYKISPTIGNALPERVYTLMDTMSAQGKTLDALVTAPPTLKNEDDFINVGIDVLRLPFGTGNEINAYLILGYLTQKEERSHEIAEFYDSVFDYAMELSEKHNSMETITALILYSHHIRGKGELHGKLSDTIGIDNVFHPKEGELARIKVESNSEWLSNPEWNADYIVSQEKFTYDNKDLDCVSLWRDKYQVLYGVLDAMPERCIIVNNAMVEPLMVAYVIEFLYPDDVEKGYGDMKHQEFIDKFNAYLHRNGFDVKTDGIFAITYEDVKDKL